MDDLTSKISALQRSDLPAIAVAICTKDRNESLLSTLESVWAQTYLPAELVVIDDGRMPDDTWEQIAIACQDAGIEWKYDRTDAPGLTSSRNRAAQVASSEIIQYLDDDVTCEPTFLERIGELFLDEQVGGVTATVREPKLETHGARRFETLCRVARWWAIRPQGEPARPAPRILMRADVATRAVWMSGCAMAYRREIILENPFDERLSEYALGEDRELGYRLMPRCWLVESKQARVVHRRDASGRANPRRFGYMTAYNYLYILNKTCELRNLRRIEPYYSLALMAMRHVPGLFRTGACDRWLEMTGILQGICAWWTTPSKIESSEAAQIESMTQEEIIAAKDEAGEADGIPFAVTATDMDSSEDASRDLRVVFVANRLEHGGAERMLVSLAKKLPAHGITPIVVCLKEAGPLAKECADAGIVVHEYLLKFKTDIAVIPRLRRLVRAERADVLVVSQSGGDRMFWTALVGRFARLPVVVWSHWFPRAGERHLERSNRALIGGVDRFIALADAHRDALAKIESIPRAKTAVIPNGIALSMYQDAPKRKRCRAALGLSDEEFAVGIIANLRKEKRHDIFIDAAARLSVKHPNMRFLIIGDGPNRDELRCIVGDVIRAPANGLNADTIQLLGPRNDIPAILAALDACCLCSETECFSVTMLEAAAAGCPFIGPAVGAMGEFLKHDETGLAIRPADAASLADAITRLQADPALGKRLADGARAALADRFTLDRTAEEFASLLHEVVAERAGTTIDRAIEDATALVRSAYEDARQLDCRAIV